MNIVATPEELAELRERFHDVMNCEAITKMTRYVPPNSSDEEVSYAELLRRSAEYAPGMWELMRLIDEDFVYDAPQS